LQRNGLRTPTPGNAGKTDTVTQHRQFITGITTHSAVLSFHLYKNYQEVHVTVPDDMQTPSEEVAQKIMERFIQKDLLTRELAVEIEAKVGNGRMQPADWKLIFEKALDLHKGR